MAGSEQFNSERRLGAARLPNQDHRAKNVMRLKANSDECTFSKRLS
jgi:hypothetical protein